MLSSNEFYTLSKSKLLYLNITADGSLVYEKDVSVRAK